MRLAAQKNEANFTLEEGTYWNKFARSTLTVDAETGESFKVGILRRHKTPEDNFVRGFALRTRAKQADLSDNLSDF